MAETRDVGGYAVSDEALYVGQVVNLDERVRPGEGASARAKVEYQWPQWAKDAGGSLPGPSKSQIIVPPLLDWSKTDTREEFVVQLPGRFGALPQIKQGLTDHLRTSQGAEYGVITKLESNVFKIVLSHFVLPEMVEFDVAKIPASPNEFYLGLLCDGSDLIWDTTSENNALIAGQNGGGKTQAAKSILGQAWVKGWDATVITPGGASLFSQFKDLPRFRLITGRDDAALAERAEFLAGVVAEFAAREEQMLAYDAAVWGDTVDQMGNPIDPSVWVGSKIMIYLDESSQTVATPVRHAMSEAAAAARLSCAVSWKMINKEGRKYGVTAIVTDQEPSVDHIGHVMNEIAFFLVLRSLRLTHVNVVFSGTTSSSPQEVLVEPGTPKGRGVARGAKPPGGALSDMAVNDAAVQVAFLSNPALAALLADGLPEVTQVRGEVIETTETPPLLDSDIAEFWDSLEPDRSVPLELGSGEFEPEPEFEPVPSVPSGVSPVQRAIMAAWVAVCALVTVWLLLGAAAAFALVGLVVAVGAFFRFGPLGAAAAAGPALAATVVALILGSV